MTKEISEKINMFEKKCRSNISVEWLVDFFKLLDWAGVDKQLILDTLDFALCDEVMAGYCVGGNSVMLEYFKINTHKKNDEFFKYMREMAKKMGKESFKSFLENAVVQIKKDFEKHQQRIKSGELKKQTSFLQLFLKQLLIQNPQDVIIKQASGVSVKDCKNKPDDGVVGVYIAGIPLILLHYEFESDKIVHFTDFRTAPGLEGIGLGSYLFSHFCKDVSEYKSECLVIASNVKKGRSGSEAYSAWGAFPSWLSGTKLSQDEYEKHGTLCYCFMPEVVKQMAKRAEDSCFVVKGEGAKSFNNE